MDSKINQLKEQASKNEAESSFSSAAKTFGDEAKAERVFSILKTKLLNVTEWNDHALFSSYKLFDENGKALESETLAVGVFMRIALKGSGKYDWVRIIDVYEARDEFVLTVRPTFDPTGEHPDKNVVSHFFTEAATNNFCLLRKLNTISFYVIGLNEKKNLDETANALETVRNVAVNLGNYLGIQEAEWEKFCHDFLKGVSDEVGQRD